MVRKPCPHLCRRSHDDGHHTTHHHTDSRTAVCSGFPEQRNKKILDEVKKVTHVDLVTILKNLNQDLVKGAIAGQKFKEYFFENCKCDKIRECIETILE